MPKDIREVVITLKSSDGGMSEDVAASGSEIAKEDSDSNITKAAFSQMVLSAVQKVGNLMISRADYELDRIFSLQDDYIGQRQMAEAQARLNVATNYFSTAASGAMVGSAAGPVGAIIGAFIGLGVEAFSQKNSVTLANDRQNIMLKQMDLQLQYTRKRAGWSTHAASIGEDL